MDYPLAHLLQKTSVNRIETKNRTLQAAVQDVANQVEAKTGKKIRVLFAPESLADHTVEKTGMVITGGSPVEGIADHVLCLIANTYICGVHYVDADTILIYQNSDTIGEQMGKVGRRMTKD